MTPFENILIGDNAFIGVSHLSNARARQTLQRLNVEKIVEVIRAATSNGATGYSFTVHPTNSQILAKLESSGALAQDFSLYPILPYAAGYVRTMNEKGLLGTLGDLLNQVSMVDRAKLLVRGVATSIAEDPIGLMKIYLDYEISRIPNRAKIGGVLLHEVITDLALSYRATNIIQSFIENIRNKWHATPGFVTRNFSRFVEFFDQMKLPFADLIVMTPFNRIGFQMIPSKQSCEASLSRVGNAKVIAMSILAGGYLNLDEAAEYIRPLNLSGAVVGVSSEEHARQVFTRLRTIEEQRSKRTNL
jgi:hypothetical protein